MIWEAQFLRSLQSIRTPFWDTVMQYASLLGEYGIVGICVGLVLLFFRKTRRTGVQVLMAMGLAFIVANLMIKNAVARSRPYELYPYLQYLGRKPHDRSFPSGHTTNVFACATVIFLCHRKAGIAALAIAALVAFSRLYNGAHFPTDVLAGLAIGVIFAVLVHFWLYPACEKGVSRLCARKER